MRLLPAIAVLLSVALWGGCSQPASAPPAAPPRATASTAAGSAPPAAAKPAGSSPAAPASTAQQPAAAPAALEKLRVPYVAISVTQLPAWVAQDAGLFAKHGLDVSMEYIATGSTLVQAMVAGEAAFGIAGSEAPIAASLSGADMMILAPTVDRLIFDVYANQGVPDAAAMRGRRLAITRVGSSTDFAARQWVQSLGMRPGDEIAIVQANGQPEIFAAIQSGAADAGVLSPPTNVQAKRAGFRLLADLSKLDVPFYQSSALTTRRIIDERPETVRRFMRAFVEANSVIHQDKALTKRVLAQYTQTSDDEVLESSYEAAVPAIPRVPLPTRAAIESAIELVAMTNPAAQGVDPARFFDARFVQELEDSGFIRGLYR
jgi:NitT/TauT family transport system substrate-binding protein